MNGIVSPGRPNIKSELQGHKNVPASYLQCQESLERFKVSNMHTEIDGIVDVLYTISRTHEYKVGIAQAHDGWSSRYSIS